MPASYSSSFALISCSFRVHIGWFPVAVQARPRILYRDRSGGRDTGHVQHSATRAWQCHAIGHVTLPRTGWERGDACGKDVPRKYGAMFGPPPFSSHSVVACDCDLRRRRGPALDLFWLYRCSGVVLRERAARWAALSRSARFVRGTARVVLAHMTLTDLRAARRPRGAAV